jgi:hypothetical protein
MQISLLTPLFFHTASIIESRCCRATGMNREDEIPDTLTMGRSGAYFILHCKPLFSRHSTPLYSIARLAGEPHIHGPISLRSLSQLTSSASPEYPLGEHPVGESSG